MRRILTVVLAALIAVALMVVPSPAGSTTMGPGDDPVRSLIVRYAPGIKPGTDLAPTGAKRVAPPQRSWLRLGEPLGSRMYTIRLTRSVSNAVARDICRQLTKDPRVMWAEPDAKAIIARPSGIQ